MGDLGTVAVEGKNETDFVSSAYLTGLTEGIGIHEEVDTAQFGGVNQSLFTALITAARSR